MAFVVIFILLVTPIVFLIAIEYNTKHLILQGEISQDDETISVVNIAPVNAAIGPILTAIILCIFSLDFSRPKASLGIVAITAVFSFANLAITALVMDASNEYHRRYDALKESGVDSEEVAMPNEGGTAEQTSHEWLSEMLSDNESNFNDNGNTNPVIKTAQRISLHD